MNTSITESILLRTLRRKLLFLYAGPPMMLMHTFLHCSWALSFRFKLVEVVNQPMCLKTSFRKASHGFPATCKTEADVPGHPSLFCQQILDFIARLLHLPLESARVPQNVSSGLQFPLLLAHPTCNFGGVKLLSVLVSQTLHNFLPSSVSEYVVQRNLLLFGHSAIVCCVFPHIFVRCVCNLMTNSTNDREARIIFTERRSMHVVKIQPQTSEDSDISQ